MEPILEYGPAIGILISFFLNLFFIFRQLIPLVSKSYLSDWSASKEHNREMREAELESMLQNRVTESATRQLAVNRLAELATQQVGFLQDVIKSLLKREEVPEKYLEEIREALDAVLLSITQLREENSDANNRPDSK